MKAKKNSTPQKKSNAAELRRLAETKLNKREQMTVPLHAADALRLVHELEVHQIELEMQNEELIATRTELETALSQYTDLYDFAPVGYFTLTREGKILKTNFAGAKLLGTDRRTVSMRRFGQFVVFDSQPAFSAFMKKVFAPIGDYKETCELALQTEADTTTHWVHIEAIKEPAQSEVCRVIVVDITERKLNEEKIKRNEEYFRALVENISDVIVLVDVEGQILYTTPSAQNVLGYTTAELQNLRSFDLIHPDDLTAAAGIFNILLDEPGSTAETQIRIIRKDERIRWVDVSGVNLLADPAVGAIVSIYRDITKQVEIEATLRHSQEQISGILASTLDAIISMDADQKIMIFNRAAEKMFGCPAKEALGKSLDCFMPEFVRKDHRAYVQAFGASNTTSRTMAKPALELTCMRTNGQAFPSEVSISQLEYNGEKFYTAVIRDITERKQAELEIQRQLQRVKALRTIDTAISSSFDSRVVLDILLKEVVSQLGVDAALILLLNSSNQHLEHAVAMGFHTSNVSQLRVHLMDDYVIRRAGLEHKTTHIPNLAVLGEQFSRAELFKAENFVTYFRVPLISKGVFTGVLEIFQRSAFDPDREWLDFLETLAGQAAIAIDNAQLFEDLQRSNTELEQRVAKRTEELHRTNVELEHANRTKGEFLANMSHELRTPLNSILGLSETLLEQLRDPLSERQQRSLQVIESSGHHLLDLINDVLDLSKIEAGKFDYYPQVVTVDEVCRISLSFVKESAVKKSIMLNYESLPQTYKIYADPRRLKQILVNLLTNAVKFTPEHGEVHLKVTADAEQDLMRFSVSDTGIGIAPADLQKLFVPFTQVDSSLTREYEGTGLGLALIQKLTDLHGGSVEVESVVGKGSRFTINLSWGQEIITQQANAKTVSDSLINKTNSTVSQPAREHGTILLAEDNLASVLMVDDYLTSHGYQVAVAHDGLETIEKAQAQQPDLILMDIQMPVLNGLETISRLRGDPRFASTPIIALTALAMPGDRERCIVAGANEYMSKPVSLKGLLKTIHTLLDSKA